MTTNTERRPILWRRLVPPLIVVLFGALILFPALGQAPIQHSDEGRFIGAALNALSSDDWVVPLQDGRFNTYYGKPPLGHMLSAWTAGLLGVSKTALRLPYALAGLVALLLILAIGDRLRPGAGLLAVLLLITAPGWAHHHRIIWLESLLVVFDLAAMLAYSSLARRPGAHWWHLLPAAALIACSLMTKQVVGLFSLFALLTTELLSHERYLRRLAWVSMFAIVPLLIWAIFFYTRIGDQAWQYLGVHVVPRFTGAHPEVNRRPGDFINGWFSLLGSGVTTLGLIGMFRVAIGCNQTNPGTTGDTSITFLRYSLMSYVAWQVLV